MLVGGMVADRVTRRIGARGVASLGFMVLAGGLALGATTSLAAGDGRALAWVGLSGLGLGLVLPTTIDAALAAVGDENSGVSSGVIQALRTVGGLLGAAILGAVMNSVYRDQVVHNGATLPQAAGDSAVAGVDAATSAHSPALLHVVQEAFLSGMSATLWICAALMAVGGVLAVAVRRRATGDSRPQGARDVATEVAA